MKQKRSASDIKEKEAEWQKVRRQNPIINRQITEINKKKNAKNTKVTHVPKNRNGQEKKKAPRSAIQSHRN